MATAGLRFPFTAIVGQDRMKLALLLNAVNPGIGGVLIRGNKGTAKSTAVRALATVLPTIEIVRGCTYSCAPGAEREDCAHCSTAKAPLDATVRPVRILDLPVGASEDRLVGSLDIERALASGEQAFEPGLLAAAHRGILYVDEVNLLNDHLVDVLLDAAAMGRNYVERDGLSVSHPARFILVGTMNPEEGELRPQLLDRFGLMAEADHTFTTTERVEVVKRRIAFDADPARFIDEWREREDEIRMRIADARALLPTIRVSDEMLDAIAHVCHEHAVDGLRADIVIHRTASTIAAWHGRADVNIDDVRDASELALAHRQRRRPFEEPRLDPEKLNDTLQNFERNQRPREHDSTPPAGRSNASADEPAGGVDKDRASDEHPAEDADRPPERAAIGEPIRVAPPTTPRLSRRARAMSGRGKSRAVEGTSGHHVGTRPVEGVARDLDLSATIRVAAPRQHLRESAHFEIRRDDLYQKIRETSASALVVFVVDASGSMGARERMEATKGAILSLLIDAYQKRNRVALITVRGAGAEEVLPPTRSIEVAHRHLAEIETGGRTPLWAGLERAAALVLRERRHEPDLVPLLVLVSDGRANVARGASTPTAAVEEMALRFRELSVPALVVDTESGYVRLGRARTLARLLEADYVAFEELEAGNLAGSVRKRLTP